MELANTRRVTHFPQRFGLDLADAFAGDFELFADLFERARLAPVETETQLENFALALVEGSEQARDLFGEQCGPSNRYKFRGSDLQACIHG